MKQQILETFLHNHRLKFNEIEKLIKIRSNKLAYYIKKLEKEGILEKEKDFYKLSETSEKIIPYLTKKQAVLPVILIALEKNRKIFLHQRDKRPFTNKLSLPGGRIIVGETIQKATQRIMKEKFNINCKFQKVNSISLEHVKKNNQILHSFLLILVKASTKESIEYLNPTQNKSKIISSDYKLIKNDLGKKIELEKIISQT